MFRPMRHTFADLQIASATLRMVRSASWNRRKRIEWLATNNLPTDEAIALLGHMRIAPMHVTRHRDLIAEEVKPD